MIRYVFWDNDNTLVETAALHWRKHKETLARHGINLHDSYRKMVYHNNGQQNWEWMTRDLGLSCSCDVYLDEIDTWYEDHLGEASIREGVLEALTYFKNIGAHQAVVSNGRKRSVLAILNAKSLLPYFEFVLGKEDYEGRKPDPAPYLSALARMAALTGHPINLLECLAIEDEPVGVTAASRANLPVIHRRFTEEEAPAPEAFASVFSAADFIWQIKNR